MSECLGSVLEPRDTARQRSIALAVIGSESAVGRPQLRRRSGCQRSGVL